MSGQVLKRDDAAASAVAAPRIAAARQQAAAVQRSDVPAIQARHQAAAASSTEMALASAKAELERLRQDLDDLRRRAIEEGRRDGMKEGLKAAQEKAAQALSEQLAALRQSAKSLDDAAAQLRERTVAGLADVVLAAVRRMLGEAWAQPDAARDAIRAVLKEAAIDGPATVQVHTRDLDHLRAMAEAHPELSLSHVEFAAHPEVQLGGCRVVTAQGTLDARLETQLALLREALDAARSRDQGAQA